MDQSFLRQVPAVLWRTVCSSPEAVEEYDLVAAAELRRERLQEYGFANTTSRLYYQWSARLRDTFHCIFELLSFKNPARPQVS